MLILSHPTGNANVRAVAAAMHSAGLLTKFFTTVSADPLAPWLKFAPEKFAEQWLRRSYSLPKSKISDHPYLELARMFLPKIKLERFVKNESAWASLDSVYKRFDGTVAKNLKALKEKKHLTAVYAYEDGAYKTFKAAKEQGLKCIYDLPIAYWETARKLLQEEAERLPQWSKTLGGGISDSKLKLERKAGELELSDVIISPSEFVAKSLPHWAHHKKLIIAPFGSPLPLTNRWEKQIGKNNKLKILFAGSMSQRKGLADLFTAMKSIDRSQVELIVMGSLMEPIEFYKKQFGDFTYLPNRPHNQVLQLMQSCDLFCLPSIVEGRALVMQEAMSQGLPLIITANTGGADLVIDGLTGFLVPIRAPEAIADKINWFIKNRHEIPFMSQMAIRHSAKYTWGSYAEKILSGLEEFN